MLSLVEFAEFLTNRLNEIGATQNEKYEFNIYAEVGEAKAGVINGALRTDFPQTTPVADLVNVKYDLRVEFAVPSGLANFNVKNIEEIISLFIEAENGVEKTFSSGKGLITATLSRVKDFKVEPKVGTMLPLEFVIRVNYTEDVITSGSKHWFLNDLEIPFLNESVIVEKNGVTKNISGQNYKETFLTEKLKLYRFRFPFDTKNALCSMLQKDLLESGANKTYTLRYYDGVSFLNEEGKDFKTTVSIYRTNDTSSVKPETAMFDITFTDVKLKSNVKYFMGLIDNPFDGQTEDTMYFESLEEQQEWFNEMIANGCKYEEIPVPNLDSIDVTNQIYNFDAELYNVFDVTKKNYAVIKVVIEKENSEDVEYYFYYNITNPQIGTENQVSFSMQLDSLQTYYFIDEIKFEGSFIQKTLLNRWKQVDENTIEFNLDANSKLFEREEIKNVAKRLVSRQKLKYRCIYPETEEQQVSMVAEPSDEITIPGVNEGGGTTPSLPEDNRTKEKVFIDEMNKVGAWCYVYLDAGDYNATPGSKVYRFVKSQIEVRVENQEQSGNVFYPSPTAIICFPIGNDLEIQRSVDRYYYINLDGWLNFCEDNLGTASDYIKGIKLSIKPPFNLKSLNSYDYYKNINNGLTFIRNPDGEYKATIRENYLYAIQTGPNGKTSGFISNDTIASGVLVVVVDYLDSVPLEVQQPIMEKSFSKEEVFTSGKDKRFNPKLNSEDYKNLSLTIAGASFNLPLDKMNLKKPEFEYFEALTPETTKGLLRLGKNLDEINPNLSVFNYAYLESFNGFSYSNDFTIAFAKEVYAQYIANNKNAYLSFQAQQNYNRDVQNISMLQTATSGLLSSIGGTGGYQGGKPKPFNALSSSMGVLETGANIAFSEMTFLKGQELRQTQFDLSMDNMRNAPSSLANINGSAILTQMVDDFGIYAEVYEGLDHELEIANDIMARDGYTYNQFDDVKKYDKVRKFFNYIKANIGTITGIPISNQARADLRNRFANGVRFWNKNEEGKFVVDYSKENYEKWIETAYSSFEEWLENQ